MTQHCIVMADTTFVYSHDAFSHVFDTLRKIHCSAMDDYEGNMRELAIVKIELDVWRKVACVCKAWRCTVQQIQNSAATLEHIRSLVEKTVSSVTYNNQLWAPISEVMCWEFGISRCKQMNLFVLKTIFRKMEKYYLGNVEIVDGEFVMIESYRNDLLVLVHQSCKLIHRFVDDEEIAEFALAFVAFLLETMRLDKTDLYRFDVLLSTELTQDRVRAPMAGGTYTLLFGTLDKTLPLPSCVSVPNIVSAVIAAVQQHPLEQETYRWSVCVMKILDTMPRGVGVLSSASSDYFALHSGVSALLRGAKTCTAHGRSASIVNMMVFLFLEYMLDARSGASKQDFLSIIVEEQGHVVLLQFLLSYRSVDPRLEYLYDRLRAMLLHMLELRNR